VKRRLLVTGAAVGVSSLLAANPWRRPAPPPEQPASWQGVELADLHGVRRGVAGASVVNLWARWCAPCRRELPALQRLAAQLLADRQSVVTLALDDEAFALREYVRDIGLTLPVLLASSAALPPALRPASLPQTLRLDRAGRVVRRVVGARDWDDAAARRELLGGESA
jgi:thiol-disulfide isomerase/thioredoxin